MSTYIPGEAISGYLITPKQKLFCELQAMLALESGGMADDVLAFMVAFDQLPRALNEPVSAEDLKLAHQLVAEEAQEFFDALENFKNFQSIENLTEVVDGAVDSIYVLLWTLLKFGVPVNACFDEVQRSNMAKLFPDGSYKKYEDGPKAGKVMKPTTWTAPDLHSILVEHFDAGEYVNGIRKDE